MERQHNKGPLYLFAFTSLLGVALFWILRRECYQAEGADVACLTSASNLISFFAWIGQSISRYPSSYFPIAVGLGAIAVAVLAWPQLRQESSVSWKTLYVTTVLIALAGELAALLQAPWLALGLHGTSLCTAIASFRILSRTSPDLITSGWIEPMRPTSPPRRAEVVTLTIILLLICVTRFYALNRIPYFFDGEACPHRPITMSWTQILEQEAGQNVQQSSGMSWPILHKWFTRPDHPTLFYLDERTLGVGISFAACMIVFWGFRYLCGPFTAFLALIIYAFGPLDLGWSRLPILHHFPVAVGMLLALASLAAFSARSWKSFFAVCVLMAITKFIYPSGKLLALGPFLGMLGALVWHRPAWKGHKRKLCLVALGGVIFLVSRPFIGWLTSGSFAWVSPFPITQIEPLADSPWGLIKAHAWQAFGFLYEIFYGQFDSSAHHWTLHATIEPLRSVASVCTVFVTLALARILCNVRHPCALVAIGLLVGGLIPAVSSGLAERRIAFSLVFVSCLAIVELSWFINTFIRSEARPRRGTVQAVLVACLGGILFLFHTNYFLTHSAGKHMQLIMTEAIRPRLKDGTLLVQLGPDYRCEIFYGIYDILKAHEGRIGYTNPYEANRTDEDFVTNPHINPHAWFYWNTDLKSQTPSFMPNQTWANYLFVTQYTDNRVPLFELLKETYPNGKMETIQTQEATHLRLVIFETSP